MTEPSCSTCRHYQPLHQICGELLGHLFCQQCRRTFQLDMGESARAEPFHCPACGQRGQDKAVEDVSGGRPGFCPGWIERPNLEPQPVQRSLFG